MYEVLHGGSITWRQYYISGGALHLHDTALIDLKWVIAHATYRDDCYMCFQNDSISFKYIIDDASLHNGKYTVLPYYYYNMLQIIICLWITVKLSSHRHVT